jgi:hypothetical protein
MAIRPPRAMDNEDRLARLSEGEVCNDMAGGLTATGYGIKRLLVIKVIFESDI